MGVAAEVGGQTIVAIELADSVTAVNVMPVPIISPQEEFEAWFRQVAPGEPAVIIRFGTADTPSTRTGKLPVSSKVASASASARR